MEPIDSLRAPFLQSEYQLISSTIPRYHSAVMLFVLFITQFSPLKNPSEESSRKISFVIFLMNQTGVRARKTILFRIFRVFVR